MAALARRRRAVRPSPPRSARRARRAGGRSSARMSDAGGDLRALPSGSALWDAHAQWWKATFTGGADPEYDREIIPIVCEELAGARRILDLGCGEGQVARALVASEGASSAPEVV